MTDKSAASEAYFSSFPTTQRLRSIVRFCFRTRQATSTFRVGEHQQATTAESLAAISLNSFVNRFKRREVDRLASRYPGLVEMYTRRDSPSTAGSNLISTAGTPTDLNHVQNLDYSRRFKYTNRVSLDPTSHRKGTRVSRLDERTGSRRPTNIQILIPAFLKKFQRGLDIVLQLEILTLAQERWDDIYRVGRREIGGEGPNEGMDTLDWRIGCTCRVFNIWERIREQRNRTANFSIRQVSIGLHLLACGHSSPQLPARLSVQLISPSETRSD